MEIQLSNLALKHLIEELKFIENGFVNNVQTLENNWIKMKVHTKQFGDKQLILTPNSLFVSNSSLAAKQNPGGFSALLKKYLNNQRIVSLAQRGADRIAIIDFPEVVIILELFAKGNIVLCDKEMKIIRAMRKEEWKDRKLEQGEQYKFPSSKGINPLEENEKDFEKKLAQNVKTFFGACVDTLNASPTILEFAFDELKLDKKKNSKEATAKESKRLLEKVKEIYSSKEGKVFLNKGVIYSTEIKQEKEKEFESIQAALNTILLNGKIKTQIVIKGPSKEETKKKEKQEKHIEAKNKQIEGLGVQEKEAQQKGEEIFIKYQEIKEVLSAIEKGKQKGLIEKEIISKINSLKPIIKELDFKKNTLVIEI
ncbi:MAG: NFACT family protein [archaeon]